MHCYTGSVSGSAGLSRWTVCSHLGLRLLELEGKSSTQEPCHDWCLLDSGTCILALWVCHLLFIELLLCFRQHRKNFTWMIGRLICSELGPGTMKPDSTGSKGLPPCVTLEASLGLCEPPSLSVIEESVCLAWVL